jgi:hypothetical protein
MTLIISTIYRMSWDEWTKLRESVPYVKIYRYNPKHLYPKMNGYGDNGQRKVWTSFGFHALYVFGLGVYPTLRMSVLEWLITKQSCATRLSVCTSVVLTEYAVTCCKNAFCVFPRGILWHAFCVWILWWQCTSCCRRIPKTISRLKNSV